MFNTPKYCHPASFLRTAPKNVVPNVMLIKHLVIWKHVYGR
jgi:hypothetical protein